MYTRKNNRTSVSFLSDDAFHGRVIEEGLNILSGAYETSLVKVKGITIGEIILGTNLPSAERACFIKEITQVFDDVMVSLGGK